MRRAARILVLVLPVLALAGLWGWTERWSRQGTDWEVPIQGYDPRDLLRGHYIQFQYDWPGVDERPGFATEALADETRAEDDSDEIEWPDEGLRELCLIGTAPGIESVSLPEGGTARCANYIRADDFDSYYSDGLRNGRLYVPQTQARELERKLFDEEQRATVRIRLRDDGTFTPQEITFRPLTEAERAAREDAEQALPEE